MALEMLPIGAILAVVTNQVIKTAHAANDVLIENASFKVLSKHLLDIEPVLKELQAGKLNESPGARKALEFLESDVKKANNLVEKYKNRARFYLLIKSRNIVKEVQDVTRDIGRSLSTLSLVNSEVLLGISDQVDRLQNEMQRAEFETSQSRVQIIDRLNQGLTDQKLDQGFANDLLKDIACAVGVSIEPSEIRKEMESFKREKEEAANRKERAEVFFLEQVIELLSRADAARDYEQVKGQYMQRLRVIERYDPKEEYIEPFKAFICGITQTVMVDPVSLYNGTTYERGAIEAWFERGRKSDPVTGDPLEDLSYRSNIQLRHSIQEWKELNYCVKIRSCKAKLMSEIEESVEEALGQMQGLMRENSINKDWVSIGGLTEVIISILGSSRNQDVKKEILITLKDIVEGHVRNKDLLVENKGFEHIVPCLGCESDVSNAAIELLHELVLQGRSGQNVFYTRELLQQCNPIPFLVTLVNGSDRESAEKPEEILVKLCDIDDDNIIHAARLNWFRPLINRIIQGSGSSRNSMVRALVNMELEEQNIKLLGEKGLIPPLLEMASTDLESKEVSLSLLVKLSVCHENKRLIAEAGGVPIVLQLMGSFHLRTIIIARCTEILEKLSSNGDGIKFLVDENGQPLELESLVKTLLSFQQNPSYSHIVKKPALQALLGICQSEAKLVKIAVLTAGGVSLVLPLLDHSDIGIREAAINLLFLFSNHEPQGVAEYLLKPRRLEALVGLLEDHAKSDVQKAAAGLLANLPKSEITLTKKLIELDGLKAIINILSLGTMEAKEHALSALFRFTDPTNLESQKKVVELGAYPLLVNLLKTGSVTAKARAAGLVGDLSLRSSELTVISKKSKCLSFHRANISICPAHGGICSTSKSFCILESKALPEIVKLLHGKVHATAYEAIQTLSTLVQEESPRRGAHVLHENNAIGLILEVLNWGSESLKEEALGVLEKIFMLMEMGEIYGSRAKLLLIRLTSGSVRHREEGHLQRKAARVLLMIERCSRSSRSLVATAASG